MCHLWGASGEKCVWILFVFLVGTKITETRVSSKRSDSRFLEEGTYGRNRDAHQIFHLSPSVPQHSCG